MTAPNKKDATTARKRFEVKQVGCHHAWADTLEEAERLKRQCYEASWIIDYETGQMIGYGGSVSG